MEYTRTGANRQERWNETLRLCFNVLAFIKFLRGGIPAQRALVLKPGKQSVAMGPGHQWLVDQGFNEQFVVLAALYDQIASELDIDGVSGADNTLKSPESSFQRKPIHA